MAVSKHAVGALTVCRHACACAAGKQGAQALARASLTASPVWAWCLWDVLRC